MTVVRNQHYVPQRYLRRFTEDGSRLYCFDKKPMKSFGPVNVKKVGSEVGFFDVTLESVDGNTHMAEDYLTKVENYTEAAFETFLKQIDGQTKFDILSPELKEAISFGIAFQFLRTKEFRKTLAAAATNFASLSNRRRDELLKPIAISLISNGVLLVQKKDESGEASSYLKDTPNEHAAALFGGGFELTRAAGKILENYIWFVSENRDNLPLYTSDAPVILCPFDHVNSLGGLGLSSPGVEVAMPLSSKYILVLFEPSCGDGQEYERCILPLNPDGVARYNALQVWSSYRQIYCAVNYFDYVLKTIERSPELSDIDRPRYQFHGQIGGT